MLSLLAPRSAEGIEYNALMAMVAGNRQSDDTSTAPATLDHNQALEISRSLTSIQLCLDRGLPAALRSLGDDEDMGFDHQDYWPLLGISNLIRLYCYGDDASRDLGFLLQEDGPIGCGAPPEGYLGTVQEVHAPSISTVVATLPVV
jgi:hypothetical protein